jgi:hypothetical protein
VCSVSASPVLVVRLVFLLLSPRVVCVSGVLRCVLVAVVLLSCVLSSVCSVARARGVWLWFCGLAWGWLRVCVGL